MIACFLSNISAKYYKNPSMLSWVIAKNVGDVFFLRHSVVQRAIKTIVPLWRQFHTDADADSVSSTVISSAYMYIENKRIMYSSQMWHKMQTEQHFITNSISRLQIWVTRPSWPDPWVGSRRCNSGTTTTTTYFVAVSPWLSLLAKCKTFNVLDAVRGKYL